MERMYLWMQLVTSLYVVQLLFGEGLPYGSVVLMMGAHLVLYLVGEIVNKDRYGRYELWIKGIDFLYIMVLVSQDVVGSVLIWGLLCVELVVVCKGVVQKLVLGSACLVVSWQWQYILENWYLLGLVVGACIVYNAHMKRLRQLRGNQQELLDRLGQMSKTLAYTKRSKKDIAQMTKIAERNQIAQKLHDKVGHVLAGSIMQLEAVKIIVKQDEEKGLTMLEGTIDHLRTGMDDIRMALRELKPDTGENGIGKVREMLVALGEKAGIETSVSFEGDLDAISMEIWMIVRDNLSEAITNFMKYSKGNHFGVRIEVMNKIIKVQIRDNGLVEGEIKLGLGIRGMEERVVECGGRFMLNTHQGFEIMMVFGR
ncbi:MAG: sensor histidine kinase [Cellulosilyticaceae bacterium]